MADLGLDAVITTALADAGDSSNAGDTGDTADVGVDSDVTETATTTESAETGVVDPAATVVTQDDNFDRDIGVSKSRSDGKENRIPYSRVKIIAENKAKAAIAPIAEALGIKTDAADFTFDALHTTVKERLADHKTLTDRMANIDQVEGIMSGDPDRFMQMLVQINPGYKRYVDGIGNTSQNAAVEPAQSVAATSAMPEPDLDLGEGKKTYSVEGLQNLLKWNTAEAVRTADEKMGLRLKPWEERDRQATLAREQEASHTQRLESVRSSMAEAETWEGYAENKAEILKALQEDSATGKPRLSLEGAYRKVVVPKFKVDQDTMRKRILEEMKKAPTSTAVSTTTSNSTTGSAATHAGNARETLDDVIRASLAKLKR